MVTRVDLENTYEKAKAAVAAATSLQQLDQVRVEYLGKRGKITSVLKTLGRLTPEERKEIGQVANKVRQNLEGDIEEKQEELSSEEVIKRLAAESVDITLPGREHVYGRRHLISQVIKK